MATHRVSIVGAMALPDTSGAAYFEPASILNANDLYNHMLAVFTDSGAKNVIGGRFNVPKNYVGTPKIIVVWETSATSGDVVWDFDYTAVGGDAAESLDPAAHQESGTVTDTASGTARRRQEASMDLTAGNLAADDTVLFGLGRDGASGSDTLAASAYVVDVLFQYADA